MPYPFVLPTTSSFSFSTYFVSHSHPSLPLSASTYRGVVRETLKKHKRLPPSAQSANLSSVLLCLNNYVPYLLAIDASLGGQQVAGEHVDITAKSTPALEWRPTISENVVPGRELTRIKVQSLEYEICFVLSSLAYTYTLLARSSLHPLYSSASASLSTEQRTGAITTATKYLLSAASVHNYLGQRLEPAVTESPCLDIAKSTFRALTSLALAEATFLAVLKDDPYLAAVAQERNKNDKEWMIKAPDIPKVRAHLFARLCLAAAEHAANASALLRARTGKGKIDDGLVKYADDLRRTGRGKACRFFGIDAELGGQTGAAIAWMQAGLHELGFGSKEASTKKVLSLGRLKKDWTEKREDEKIEKGAAWGSDAGKFEEARVLEMLEKKWSKENDTVNTQHIPPTEPLVASMPSGREIHSLKPFIPPTLDPQILEGMRTMPDRGDDCWDCCSSEDETDNHEPVGAFPGTKDDYAGSGQYY